MTPTSKSHSAKPASGSKAKSTLSLKKIKQELLKKKPVGQYFVLPCDDYLMHLKKIATPLHKKENDKKSKQKLLEDHKSGQYFVLSRNDHLLYPRNIASGKENRKNIKQLLKGQKPGRYFVTAHNTRIIHLLHSKM
jgi:hypothetical protein